MKLSNSAESTAQTSSGLKRCSGTKFPEDKSHVLTEPHYTEQSNFGKNNDAPDGLKYRCRSCYRAYNNARYTLKPDSYQKSNSEYKKRNKDKVKDSSRNYRQNNPDKSRANTQRRRALKRGVGSEKVNPEKLLELHGNRCYLCGIEADLKWSASNPKSFEHEHVIPLSRGGKNTYANSRVACRGCNGSKKVKTYFEYETQRSTHYVTIENLYLFNEVYAWHVQTFWAEVRKTLLVHAV